MARFVRRSWGWYLTLLDREHFKVKLLWFRNEAWMRPQYHNHRCELWLMLSGYGAISSRGMRQKLMSSGDYYHVDLQADHSFATAYGQRALILEIQYGEKCEETDIVRL